MTNTFLKQDLRTLINSHLFCVDNLSDTEIRERLTKDGPPAHYEGQHIPGYHWFAYPNAAEGLYSEVLARANMFGDLVVGNDEETCLVLCHWLSDGYNLLSLMRASCVVNRHLTVARC